MHHNDPTTDSTGPRDTIFPKRMMLGRELKCLCKDALANINKRAGRSIRFTGEPEAAFWSAYLNEANASDRLKEVFIHQNQCLLEVAHQPQFMPDDLKGWAGKVLIIESEDDPAIPPRDRALLRSTYPKAHVHTFLDAGHASSILKRDEVFSIIKSFLQSV